MNDLRATLTLRFGLARDGPDHRLVDIDMLDLDVRDLDAPRQRLRIKRLLNVDVELFALRQHFVQFVLAEHRTERGLRELARRHHEVLDLDDRLLRIHDTKIDDGVHLDRHVVA